VIYPAHSLSSGPRNWSSHCWMPVNLTEVLSLMLVVTAVVTRPPTVLSAHFLFLPRIRISSITQLDLYPAHTAAMAQRVTLRKRQPYNTTSSRRRIVKTPGGVLRYHHIKKLPTAPKCGDCGSKLSGVRSPLAIPYFHAYHRLTGEIGCCPSPTSIRNCVQDEKTC